MRDEWWSLTTAQSLPARCWAVPHSHLSLDGERMSAEINAGGQARPTGNMADAQMEKGHVTKLVHLEDLDDDKIASGDPDPSFFRQRRAGRDDVQYLGRRERRY